MGNNSTDKDFTIIKARIFTPKHNFYGLMVAIMDNYTSAVGNISLVFSIYSDTHNLSPEETWDEFEKKIQDMTYSGNYSKAITVSTINKLKGDTSISTFGSELKDNVSRNNIELINKQFHQILSKELSDPSVEITCNFEGVTSAELQEGRRRETEQSSNEPEDSATPPDYRLVKAKLILAPVDGKLITELKEGDNILLSLLPVSMIENSIIDKLKLRRPDGSARPAPGKIIKIQNYGKGWQLLVHLMENYYAKIIEEEKILVKIPTGSGAASKSSSKKNSGKKDKSVISWLAIGAIILLGMVITYFAFLG
jgi:hypothetical protein